MAEERSRSLKSLLRIVVATVVGMYLVSFAILVHFGHDQYWDFGYGFVYSENETVDDVLAFAYYPLYRAARVFVPLSRLRSRLKLGYELPPEQEEQEIE
jgi:hypothetical protein